MILLLAIITSCTPPVVFDQAYPSDQADLASIPHVFQGAFICESDSSLVIISDTDVTMHRTHYFNTKMSQVEERANCKIVDDKMYISGRLECIPVSVVNDSTVRGTYKETDTLFVMQEGSVARIHKGHLVLSQELNKNEWAVSLLTTQQGGDLTFRAITKKSKIKNVSKVTHPTDITTYRDNSPRYSVSPTMKEFDALLADDKVFIECEYLLRVHLDDSTIH